jgi:dihydrofolate synthase / folylpolyglutamate synthase
MSLDRSYQETINYLFALQKHGVKLALANSITLMEIMDSPHRKFRTVHVAGTNGKGSTSACVASILQMAGYRVGLYTSPHLVSFTERIRINGKAISEADVIELAQSVRDAYRGLKSPDASGEMIPTFFEVTTAIAFRYFADQAVDLAVIEVGMGGRLDSTNVIMPLVSVITNIDLEHTEFLGTALQQIAGEKAGIIKPSVPLVTGAKQPEVINLFEREALAKGAPLFRLQKDFRPENCAPGVSQVFDYRGLTSDYTGLRLNLIGRYQVDNACLALAAIECLRDAGIAVSESALRSGLEQVRWEGRMERVARRPDIYLDGAHNPASARALAGTITELKQSHRRLVLVIGILGDKDYHGILAELLPLADHVVVTKPQYSRALDIGVLTREVRNLHASVDAAETVGEAIERSRERASADDLILVTGSLYVVGDAKAFILPDRGMTGALTSLKG